MITTQLYTPGGYMASVIYTGANSNLLSIHPVRGILTTDGLKGKTGIIC